MATSPILFNFNSSLVVRENNTDGTPNRTLVANGQDYANFVDTTDANRTNGEMRIQISPSQTQIIPLPAGSTMGVAIAYSFSQKLNLVFSYGTVTGSQYGLSQQQFTSLSITAPGSLTGDTFGVITLLGN